MAVIKADGDTPASLTSSLAEGTVAVGACKVIGRKRGGGCKARGKVEMGTRVCSIGRTCTQSHNAIVIQ